MKNILLLVALLCAAGASGQIVHPLKGDKLPWTSLPQGLDPENFRFIVIPDRTGGETRQIFDDAVPYINKEKAGFMITIGDMIEGYSENVPHVERMWEEYLKSIRPLNAPVFFIPGNHDITNRVQERIWLERFGYTHYYFLLGDNLFLVLDTENGGEGTISGQQSDEVVSVINRYGKDKTIFVFMHRPLWKSTNKRGYAKIEKALENHRVVLFCGHEHTYLKSVRNGNPHYMVATLGGGSALRSVDVGELNHYMVVDVHKHDVRVRNVLDNGQEIPDDIVNDGNIHLVETLRRGTWGKIPPVVMEQPANRQIPARLILSNPIGEELSIDCLLPEGTAYECVPARISRVVPALGKDTAGFLIQSAGGPVHIDSLQNLFAAFTASYPYQERRIEIKSKAKIVTDYIRDCTRDKQEIVCDNPGYVIEGWNWDGADDGSFRIGWYHDADSLHLEIRTYDDILLTAADPDALQDKLFIHYSDNAGAEHDGQWELTGSGLVRDLQQDRPSAYRLAGTCHTEGNSLVARVSIPLRKGMDAFRLNIGFTDFDDPLNTDPSTLWWKPLWNTPADYDRSGMFRLKNAP